MEDDAQQSQQQGGESFDYLLSTSSQISPQKPPAEVRIVPCF
jgi:hypothetical protein